MKLIKLYSNLEGFRSINFNLTGLSFVFGEQSDLKSTYNGTGKTLMVALIDFCLGSNKKPQLQALNCDFFLDYLDNGTSHTIKRNTIKQNEVFLDDQKYTLNSFKEKISETINLNKSPNISARTKLAMVCRFKKAAFIDPVDSGDGATEFQHILNLLDEFGFDLSLSYQKNKNNTDLNISKKVVKQLKSKDIKDVLVDNDRDIKTEKAKIQRKIIEKEEQLKKFKVAENIEELKGELANLREKYNNGLNRLVILNKKADKIRKSLKENIYYDEKRTLEKYNEYKEIFGNDIIKNIDDVIMFHNDLLGKRIARQNLEFNEINKQIDLLEKEIDIYKKRIDDIYESLNNKIDLTELNSILSEITQLKIKYEKLNSYSEILKQQDDKQMLIKKDFTEQDIFAQKYIEEMDKEIDKISNKFNDYAFAMYGDDIDSYISIKNNTNMSSIRYNIEIKIPNDGSDGISNAKIMCFDLTLKALGKTKYEFLIHDNKIFYGLDYSVVAKLLKKIYQENIDFQYIITMNQSDYNELKNEINDDDLFNNMIESNIKIKLTENDKLLGKTIEIGSLD